MLSILSINRFIMRLYVVNFCVKCRCKAIFSFLFTLYTFEKLSIILLSKLYLLFTALRDGLYRDTGVLLAMSIVHGGQWPIFFHPVAYNSFARGPSYTDVSVDDIMDFELRHMIIKVQLICTCISVSLNYVQISQWYLSLSFSYHLLLNMSPPSG